jgi:hypothetical protein
VRKSWERSAVKQVYIGGRSLLSNYVRSERPMFQLRQRTGKRGMHSLVFAALLTVAASMTVQPAAAQGFSVLYNFNFVTGNLPGTPILDRAGNLYGTTEQGGPGQYGGYGNVYKLSHVGSSWVLSDLYDFDPNLSKREPEEQLWRL